VIYKVCLAKLEIWMAVIEKSNTWILFEGTQVNCARFLLPNSHSEINTTQVWVVGIV
jgi:hypothetical protein